MDFLIFFLAFLFTAAKTLPVNYESDFQENDDDCYEDENDSDLISAENDGNKPKLLLKCDTLMGNEPFILQNFNSSSLEIEGLCHVPRGSLVKDFKIYQINSSNEENSNLDQ